VLLSETQRPQPASHYPATTRAADGSPPACSGPQAAYSGAGQAPLESSSWQPLLQATAACGVQYVTGDAVTACSCVWPSRATLIVASLPIPDLTLVAFVPVPCCPRPLQVYSGGLDNEVSVWELRKGAVSFKLAGHSNTVTGLKVSPDGHHLLTNSMDNTLRVWDLRPFAPANRCARVGFGGYLLCWQGAVVSRPLGL
jgi:WD40 repeat protein